MLKRLLLFLCLAATAQGQFIPPSTGGGGPGGGDALTSAPLSQFAPTTSSQFLGVITDENAPDGAAAKVLAANGALSVATGKTGTFANSVTIGGSDGTTLNVMGAGGSIPSNSAAYQPSTQFAAATGIRAKIIWLTTPGSGTFTTDAGTRAMYVEVMGGGGGSAGCVGTATNSCVAGGGAGGSFAAKYYSTVNASYTYTVANGGSAGAAGLNAGGQGGDTVFNSSPVLTGFGGFGSTAPGNGSAALLSGNGGASRGDLPTSNGDVFIAGQAGALGLRLVSGSPPTGLGGIGGASILGTAANTAGNVQGAGVPGLPYGGGAQGAASSGTTATAGAAGGQGAIKITEFF